MRQDMHNIILLLIVCENKFVLVADLTLTVAKPGDALLLDIRTSQEYKSGYLPGSVNCLLFLLDNAEEMLSGMTVPS